MATCNCGKPAAFMASLCDDCINERAERMQATVREFAASDAESPNYLDRPMREGGIRPDPPASPAAIALYVFGTVIGLVLLIALFGGAILLIGVGPIALLIILAAAMKIIRQR